MAYPKIVYTSVGGTTTLNFTYPPRRVPAYVYEATRHDNVSSAGVRESLVERLDQFTTLEMDWVLSGADVTAWSSFMQYAMTGGPFSYYPDSSQAAFTNYWLEDTNWNAAYKAPGKYTFKTKLRQVVT